MMNFEKNATDTTITSAKYFRFNLFNDTIEGSESNFKKAGNPTSAQYAELMEFKAIQPTFKFAPIASTKKVEKKQTYAGLTLSLMADYIRIAGSEQSMGEFKHMVEGKTAYPTIKSWFLEEFKHFNVNHAKTLIAKHDLAERKATVRKVVKAKMVKTNPTVVELNASNF